jgi:hypothetical protein
MNRISFLESKIAPCEEEAAQAKKKIKIYMLFIVDITIVSILGYLLLVHSGSKWLTRLAQRRLRRQNNYIKFFST